MEQLNINNGKKEYVLNGGPEAIYFNPSSPEFAQRIVDAFRKCQKIMERTKFAVNGDPEVMFENLHKISEEIKTVIDAAFDEPVCDKAFSGSSAISLADGLPVWVNFLMAVIDEIDKCVSEAEKQMSPSVQRYMDKYQKKYGKLK